MMSAYFLDTYLWDLPFRDIFYCHTLKLLKQTNILLFRFMSIDCTGGSLHHTDVLRRCYYALSISICIKFDTCVKQVSEVRLFGEEEIEQDVKISICQFSSDSSQIVIHGLWY